jgi:prepilin-type N-terminal cleavage/methylation domain-containing protein
MVRGGFTLMEILVVVAIILILVGGGTFYLLKNRDEAMIMKAKAGVKALETTVLSYNVKHGQYPGSLQELLQPDDSGHAYCDAEALVTPWKAQYQYDPSGPNNGGQKPDIWADGPNGRRIGNWPGAG